MWRRTVSPKIWSVAFLEFTINGTPAADLHALRPGQVHDLDLVIRVSHWPQEADSLAVSPVSIEPQSIWELPRFSFARPAGPPPYVFQREGRMVIKAPQGFAARPLEFLYAAEFQPSAGNQRVVIAGQRRLRLDRIDPASRASPAMPISVAGYWKSGEQLRTPANDRFEDAIRNLLSGLGTARQPYRRRHPGCALSPSRSAKRNSKPASGSAYASCRRSEPSLGSRHRWLVDRTDPVQFWGIRCSPKTVPAFPAEEALNIEHCDSGGGAVLVVTLLIQGDWRSRVPFLARE